MLRRMKAVASLLLVLTLSGLLQFASDDLFSNSLKNDKENFTVLQTIHQQQSALNAAWVELLQARNTLNRAGIRYMIDQNNTGSGTTVAGLMRVTSTALKLTEKNRAICKSLPHDPCQSEAAFQEINRTYNIYHGALTKLVQLLGNGKTNTFFDQPTQSYQDDFEKQRMSYVRQDDRLYDIAVEGNNNFYNQAVWMLVCVLITILAAIIAAQSGIKLALISPINRPIDNIRHIASGDLMKRIEVEGSNEIGQLVESLRHMWDRLMSTVGDVRSGADTICSGASRIVIDNSDLSSRTEQQTASLEETAVNVEQLIATVKQSARSACQASHLALSVSETVQKGDKVVDNVVQTIRDIASSPRRIANIIGVIDGVTFWAGILALNATVEATYVGEQDRGLAVVTSEIHNLAQHSIQVTCEIGGLIKDSVSRMDVGSTLVKSAGETMDEIVDVVTRVTDIMGEITSASDEWNHSIDQVGLTVAEMGHVMQQNASLVEESATAATALEKQASRPTQVVAAFRIQHGQQHVRDAATVGPVSMVQPRKAMVADIGDN